MQLTARAPVTKAACELTSSALGGVPKLVAEVLPGVGRAFAELSALTGDVLTSTEATLWREEERGASAHHGAKQCAAGKDGDVLPVQLVVVGHRTGRPRASNAARGDRQLALEHVSSSVSRARRGRSSDGGAGEAAAGARISSGVGHRNEHSV